MSSLCALVRGLPDALLKQYNFEVSHVTGGSQLLHSSFFQVLGGGEVGWVEGENGWRF